MKNWRTRKPSGVMRPTPTRKAQVPVPPERPVVSVSRKAHSSAERRGICAIRHDFEQIVRQLRQCADIGAAVAAVTLIQLFGFEMPAECGFDFRSGKPFFDVVKRGPRQVGESPRLKRFAAGRILIALRVDARDALRAIRRVAACKSLIRLFFASISDPRDAVQRCQCERGARMTRDMHETR